MAGLKLKSDFEGLGTLEEFVAESNTAFSALSNINVIMPISYAGNPVTMYLTGDQSMVLDMGDALIFSLANVAWNLTGTATYNSYTANVVNGQLVISVDAS